MKTDNVKKISKIVIGIVLGALLLYMTVRYLIPLSRLLVSEDGRTAVCQKVEGYGALAPMVFIGLMALQIVVAFIPGGPLELIAGMLFGGVWGTIWSVAGILLGTVLVFLLVKRFGRPLVSYFVSEEKMQSFGILQDEGRLEILVFLLFLIPGIPKDLLTYVVPLTRMSPGKFFAVSSMARFPAILASVLVGDSLADKNYTLCCIIAAAAAVCVLIGFIIKDHLYRKRGDRI